MQKPMHVKEMSKQRKRWLIILCASLLVCAIVGGSVTYAWLIHRPASQLITLKSSNLVITIGNNNPKTNYQMIPGNTITTVDPRINVSPVSNIDCNIYAKVERSSDFNTYFEYSYDSRWTLVETVGNVDYLRHSQKVSDGDYATENLAIYASDRLFVKTSITKSTTFSSAAPKVTVTACAVQSDAISLADQLALVKQQLG